MKRYSKDVVCAYCGKGGFRWRLSKKGKWVLVGGIGNRPHLCRRKGRKA